MPAAAVSPPVVSLHHASPSPAPLARQTTGRNSIPTRVSAEDAVVDAPTLGAPLQKPAGAE
eukprot:4448076-Pyramimonas_sp.AAC.2